MSVFFAQRGGGSPVPRGSPTCPSLIASYLEPPTPPSSPPPPLPGAGCEQEDQGESLRPSGLAMALRAAAHPTLSGSVSRADPAQPLIDWSPGPAPLPKEVMCSIQGSPGASSSKLNLRKALQPPAVPSGGSGRRPQPPFV